MDGPTDGPYHRPARFAQGISRELAGDDRCANVRLRTGDVLRDSDAVRLEKSVALARGVLKRLR